jgi:phenylacetic acid degradation operon negative regulatory protein
MLNTLHEVLIYIEDRGRVPLSDFTHWKSRQVRGALGRLERERWIKKERRNGQLVYEVSARGQQEIDDTLKFLRTHNDSWDGVWRLVMFDVPEKERDLRDKFRRGLMALNLRNLQGSVWVSSKDIRRPVQALAAEIGVVAERLNIFTARAENDRNVARCWDLDELHKEYRRFTKRADQVLSGNKRPDSYEVKKIIFDYALLRRRDPNLPASLLPRDWTEPAAHAAYLRLRKELT